MSLNPKPFIVNVIFCEYRYIFYLQNFFLLDVTSCELCHEKTFLWDLQQFIYCAGGKFAADLSLFSHMQQVGFPKIQLRGY